jgi:hypothetical protein
MTQESLPNIQKYNSYGQDIVIDTGKSLKGFNLRRSFFKNNYDKHIKKIQKFIEAQLLEFKLIKLVYIKQEDYFSFVKSFCKDKPIQYVVLNDKIHHFSLNATNTGNMITFSNNRWDGKHSTKTTQNITKINLELLGDFTEKIYLDLITTIKQNNFILKVPLNQLIIIRHGN